MRFLARNNDDPVKIVGVATLVALVCSLVVSSAAILLEPRQEAHLEAERAARMAAMLETLPGMADILAETGADSLSTYLVNLETGALVTDLSPDDYDPAAAASNPDTAVTIPPQEDFAGLRTRAPYAPVHVLERDGRVELVVLPVSGNGYQSTIHAMLALEADLNTVAALSITSQGETAGLGARIENPDWQALWPGRQIGDGSGAILISVVRGQASSPFEVDGISGATRTGNGITNMLRYWLGDHGFGPFLTRLQSEGL
jgi:Na+-transporting NADH:ubiquinone oxidoreductase subunit C